MKQFLQDLGERCDDDVVRKLMDEVDVDKDGRVDFRGKRLNHSAFFNKQ